MADEGIRKRILDRFDRPASATGKGSRVVIWTDPEREYSDEARTLELDGITVLGWDGYNSFRIKERVESEEPDSRFLIYMPGQIPPAGSNILADIICYSKPLFSADDVSDICARLDIPEEYKPDVREHKRFFRAQRNGNELRGYAPFDTRDALIRSMMAVSVSADTNDLDSIVVKLIGDYSESPDNDEIVCHRLGKYNLLDDLWDYCRKEYGFEGDSIWELVCDMFITGAFGSTEISTSPKLTRHILPKGGAHITSIVNRLRRDGGRSDDIQSLCDRISKECGVGNVLRTFDDVDLLKECDVFPIVDSIIIGKMAERMFSTRSPLSREDTEVVRDRTGRLGLIRHRPLYDALLSASELLEMCDRYSKTGSKEDASSIITSYVSEYHTIDALHRHFITSLDSATMDEHVSEDAVRDLEEYVENTYCNVFLDPIVSALCGSVKEYNDLPEPHQQDFCRKYIDENRKTVIIISDAFRYECASELRDRLGTTSRVERCELDHMISTVPSKTDFGMAALLPNEGLKIDYDKDGSYAVLIEGQSTESKFRERALRPRYPDSVVLRYEEIAKRKTSELRSELSGKKLIYIYHDTIDRTGESDDRNVFSACKRAIEEIEALILKGTSWNCTNFIVTADHGFIYRRSEIGEYDKISTVDGFNPRRRFALNDRQFGLERCIEFSMDYLGPENKGLWVSVPDSMALFRRRGETKCFAHEGISPQEIVVPVLRVNTVKGSVEEKYVGLRPGSNRSVKQDRPSFELWQDNPVNDEYRRCEYELWLEDEDGQPISQIYTVTADRDDPSDLRHKPRMNETLQQRNIRLVIRRKGDSEKQTYEYTVKLIGVF